MNNIRNKYNNINGINLMHLFVIQFKILLKSV
jgi:hypothetical protein